MVFPIIGFLFIYVDIYMYVPVYIIFSGWGYQTFIFFKVKDNLFMYLLHIITYFIDW